jgi:hypothetical protein
MSTKSSGLIGLIKKQDIAVKAVVLCALFAGILCVLVLRAPARIRGAELDKAALVSKENQKVILHLSQQVDSVKDYQVTVSPSADYSVLSTGTSIVVEFKQRLDYATKYSISLSQLKTTYGAKKLASVKYSFSTPNPVMYYLKRNYPTNKLDAEGKSKPDDEIIVYNVTSRSKETVAHLPRINQFILAGSKLVISALNDDDTTRLVELDVHTKRQKDIDLPSAGTVSNLTYSGDGSTYGFSFTSNEKKYNEKKYVNSVFTRDISSGLTIPVKGLDKSILRSSRWQFVPNSTSILAQTTDSNYIVFDINEAVLPVPIGRYQEAYNFTPDGQQVAFLDRFEGIKIYNMSTCDGCPGLP